METERSSTSGTSPMRSVEKVLEEAQYTGVLDLSGRQLHEYPSSKFELADTIDVDISRNQLAELPYEVYTYQCLEQLNCYGNVIRYIPDDIMELQNLVMLNLSRNQLSFLPSALCQLKLLEVLLVASNRLVSLPEEIGLLQRLTQLDVSCNELSQLPSQIGMLHQLQSLNVRRNRLIEIPLGVSRLRILNLDISCNAISCLPFELGMMKSLEFLRVDGNPLSIPPASICEKGLKHILKYLSVERSREPRKRSHSTDALQLPFSSPDTPSFRNNRKLTKELSVNSEKRHPPLRRICTTPVEKNRFDIPQPATPPQSAIVNGHRSSDYHKGGSEDDESVTSEGHFNNNNNDSGGDKNDYDVEQLNEIVEPEEDEGSNESLRVAELTSEGESLGTDKVATPDDVERRLPKVPAKTRDSFFEHILIEYNRSPRHGWDEEATDSDGADRNVDDDGRRRRQRNDDYGSDKSSSRSSDAEIETEVLQPRTPQSAPTRVNLLPTPEAPYNGDDMKRRTARRKGRSEADLSKASINDDDFRQRQAEIAAVQKREAQKVHRRLSREKSRPSTADKSADARHTEDSENDEDADWDDDASVGSFNPMLTVRRHYRAADERSDNVKQMRKIIQEELEIILPADTVVALSDGVLLCQLVNKILPRLVTSIYVPSQGSTKLSLAKRQKNVDNFLSACRRLQIHESLICSPSAVLEGQSIEDVATTVQALTACAVQFRQSAV